MSKVDPVAQSQNEAVAWQCDKGTGIEFLRRRARNASTKLVLLHGIGSNAESYVPLMKALPASVDVTSWNAPGYGRSRQLGLKHPTPRDYAQALESLLDALSLPHIVLVGHSLGALFAGSLAALHPQRVAALALLSPALGYSSPPGTPLPATVQARIDEVAALGPAAFAAKRAPRLVGDSAASPHVLVAVEKAMASIDPAGYAQAVYALGAGDLIRDIKAVTVPVLVAVGDRDAVTPPDKVCAIQGQLRNPAGYHLIANAGHALPQEAPAAVANYLMQLIQAAHADKPNPRAAGDFP